MIKDSGNRRKFESGAQRDVQAGKGRCDLLPLEAIGTLMHNEVLINIGKYIYDGDPLRLWEVIHCVADRCFSSESDEMGFYTALLEVSKHYEDGAKKYAERNWEKGIPIHCYIDSGVRHYLKFLRGDSDERHDRAFIWNMLGAIWTQEKVPEMIDLPFAERMTRPVKYEDKGCVSCGSYVPEGRQVCGKCEGSGEK